MRTLALWEVAATNAESCCCLPDQTEGTHANGLEIRVPVISRISGRVANRGGFDQDAKYLDVISNVVPKIWARTNSAMVKCLGYSLA